MKPQLIGYFEPEVRRATMQLADQCEAIQSDIVSIRVTIPRDLRTPTPNLQLTVHLNIPSDSRQAAFATISIYQTGPYSTAFSFTPNSALTKELRPCGPPEWSELAHFLMNESIQRISSCTEDRAQALREMPQEWKAELTSMAHAESRFRDRINRNYECQYLDEVLACVKQAVRIGERAYEGISNTD